MENLRQQIINSIEAMPEENLLIIASMLRVFKGNSDMSGAKEIDFSKYRGRGKKANLSKEVLDKYMGSAGNIFGSTEEIDQYVRDLRSDRF